MRGIFSDELVTWMIFCILDIIDNLAKDTSLCQSLIGIQFDQKCLFLSLTQVRICSSSAPRSRLCLPSQRRGSLTLTCTTPALSPTPPTHPVRASGVSAWRVFLPPPATPPTCLHRTRETRTRARTSRPTRLPITCTTAPDRVPTSSPWFLQAAPPGARSESDRPLACWLPAQQQAELRGQEAEPAAWSAAATAWRPTAATATRRAPWAHRDEWTSLSGGLTELRRSVRRVACFQVVIDSRHFECFFSETVSFGWFNVVQHISRVL